MKKLWEYKFLVFMAFLVVVTIVTGVLGIVFYDGEQCEGVYMQPQANGQFIPIPTDCH